LIFVVIIVVVVYTVFAIGMLVRINVVIRLVPLLDRLVAVRTGIAVVATQIVAAVPTMLAGGVAATSDQPDNDGHQDETKNE
jgi:hypothetical protein